MADSIRFRVQNIRMTNNIRVFLWLGLALAVWLNYSQWQMDYGPKPGAASTATSAPGEPKPPSFDDTVPQVAQPASPATDAPPTAALPGTAAATPSAPAAETGAGKVRVTTDVLVMDIDLRGGTLVYAELPAYPLVKGQAQPVVLLNQSNAATNYVMQTGLAGV
jgi:YidC/Oxa1 family membrane protein insertase